MLSPPEHENHGIAKAVIFPGLETKIHESVSKSAQGTYLLVISLSSRMKAEIGGLGWRSFPRGYYTYAGSALGTGGARLCNRLSRHLRVSKKRHWHIDFLLARKNVSVKSIVIIYGGKKLECTLNRLLQKKLGGEPKPKGFGATDCQSSCGGHLLHFAKTVRSENLVESIFGLLAARGDSVQLADAFGEPFSLTASSLQVP